MIFSSDNMEWLHRQLNAQLLCFPDHRASPRGQEIRELMATTFELKDPRNRLILSDARKVNYGFAVGELCWYVRGDNDLETMTYYNRRMSQFSDDGKTINSAYGWRMFYPHAPLRPPYTRVSQWELVIKELKEDPDSRRATIHINQTSDLMKATLPDGSKDVPCTMALQFFIRDRRLLLHVTMRSNDITWGTPYDVFSFTCLQEAMLYDLQNAGVPVDDLGSYYHTAASLHLYERNVEVARGVAMEVDSPKPAAMKPFTMGDLELLAEQWEPGLRKTGARIDASGADESIQWMASQLEEHRAKRIREAEERAAKQGGMMAETT